MQQDLDAIDLEEWEYGAEIVSYDYIVLEGRPKAHYIIRISLPWFCNSQFVFHIRSIPLSTLAFMSTILGILIPGALTNDFLISANLCYIYILALIGGSEIFFLQFPHWIFQGSRPLTCCQMACSIQCSS